MAMNLGNIKHFRPFYVYPPIALALSYLVIRHNIYRPLTIVLLLLLGIVEWTFIEYLLHRHILHIRNDKSLLRFFTKGRHLVHHERSNDLAFMFVPVVSGLAISAVSIGLRVLLFWTWQGAVMVTIGVWIGYLFYEFIHYSAHLRRSRNPIFRYLKIYHMKHHHQDEALWFGVTSPLLDYIFGTYRPIKR